MHREAVHHALVYVLAAAAFLSGCTDRSGNIEIAASDGMPGILAHYLITEKGFSATSMIKDAQIFPLTDCCSSTAQWALSSKRADIAFVCPDAAQTLSQKDPGLVIIGPVLVNSEVVVTHSAGMPSGKIAYANGRMYQKKLINRFYGQYTAVPLIPAALPYAYENHSVDGIVVDILKGISLAGAITPLCGDGGDVVTSVLVVQESYRNTSGFTRFMELLGDTVSELNDTDTFSRALAGHEEVTPEQAGQVSQMRCRFIFPGSGLRNKEASL